LPSLKYSACSLKYSLAADWFLAFSIRSTPISTRQETCMVSYCSKSLRDFSMSSIETSAKRLRDFWKRLISKISASSCEWVMIFFIIFPIFSFKFILYL